jgi:1,4-alpha-glucan branching enzyme
MTEKGTVPDADDKVPHLSAEEAEAIASGTHGNPFSVLGVQETLGGFSPAPSSPVPAKFRR